MKRSPVSVGIVLLLTLFPAGPPVRGEVASAAADGRLPDGEGKGAGELAVRLSSPAPSQGDPVLVRVAPAAPADSMTVRWRGHDYPMRAETDGTFLALFGVDLLSPAGRDTLTVEARRDGDIVSRAELPMEIRERGFPVQELTLPRELSVFDEPTLERIRRESSLLAKRFSRISSPVMWSLPFLPPVADFRPGPFGSRRVINGEPRSPHAGIDLVLPEGTPVVAIADGVVAFSGEQFFGGRSVVLDHGGGLFSVYYHLKEAAVADGRRVARGERIGSVGMSGRATGPHLHFSVRAGGGRVDPTLLLSLPPR